MALSKTTQDHDEIRQWAEKRGGKPAEVAATERRGATGILRIEFPGAKNANDSKLKEISWDEFFEKFDQSGLALVYQEVTKEGAESNFNKLVKPENASGSAKKTSAKSASKSTSKAAGSKTSAKTASAKSTARKTAATKSATAGKSSAQKASAIKTPSSKVSAKKAAAKKSASAAKSSGSKAVGKSASAKKTSTKKK